MPSFVVHVFGLNGCVLAPSGGLWRKPPSELHLHKSLVSLEVRATKDGPAGFTRCRIDAPAIRVKGARNPVKLRFSTTNCRHSQQFFGVVRGTHTRAFLGVFP